MSYGVNAPQGLVPRRYFNNAPWDGAGIETFQIQSGYATSIFTNDPVTILSTGYIVEATSATTAGATPILGVFAGCQYQVPAGVGVAGTIVNSPYWPANTQVAPNTVITAYVICDPDVVYDIQTNSSNGLPFSSTLSNANFAAGAGNINTGISTVSLDQSQVGTGSSRNLKILGLSPVPGNRWSVGNNFGYNNVEVIINDSLFRAGITGV